MKEDGYRCMVNTVRMDNSFIDYHKMLDMGLLITLIWIVFYSPVLRRQYAHNFVIILLVQMSIVIFQLVYLFGRFQCSDQMEYIISNIAFFLQGAHHEVTLAFLLLHWLEQTQINRAISFGVPPLLAIYPIYLLCGDYEFEQMVRANWIIAAVGLLNIGICVRMIVRGMSPSYFPQIALTYETIYIFVHCLQKIPHTIHEVYFVGEWLDDFAVIATFLTVSIIFAYDITKKRSSPVTSQNVELADV